MSNNELFEWLKLRGNFDAVFPEKAKLDPSERQMIFDERSRNVLPVREGKERIRYANIDYRQIAVDLVALTALCAVGLVLMIRTS